MNVIPAIIAYFVVSQYLRNRNGSGQQGQGERNTNLVRILVWMLVVPMALGFYASVAGGNLRSLPPLCACLLLIFPWSLARLVLVPLGLPRTAYCVAVLSGHFFRVDMRGGGLLAGALALLRRRSEDAAALAWLERRLARARPLRGAGLVACGLLCVKRGDDESAHALLTCADTMDPRVMPPAARRLAGEWLAAEAATRGEWRRVHELGERGAGPRSRLTRLLAAIAARLDPIKEGDTAARAPSDAGLWVRWGWAPCRRATLPLVRRALALGQRPQDLSGRLLPGQAPPAVRVTYDDPLEEALAVHATLLVRPERHVDLDLQALRRLGAAWDRALADPLLERHVLERGLVLGATGGEQVLGELAQAACGELVVMARRAGVNISEAGGEGLLHRAARQLRADLLSEVELSCDALRSRTDARRELPLLDEWREWAALRALYDRAVRLGGMELRRLAWTKLHPDVCEYAVWLFNVRREKALANTIFRWLLQEAERLKDEHSIELQKRNVKCGP